MKPSPELLADLARSGLDAEDAAKLGIEPSKPEVAKRLGFGARPSYRIPYFDFDGNMTEFYRLRFLDGEKPKYAQPAGTKPGLYLPPYFNWAEVAANPKIPILATEGEKKSAKASKCGFHCIGLGGVWSFTSQKQLIDEFRKFNWSGRPVCVIFDSDIATKPQVLGALHAFAWALSELGAVPSTAMLPTSAGEKVGLDDFLVKHGATALTTLERESFALLNELWRINSKFAMLLNPVGVLNTETDAIIQTEQFRLALANRRIPWPDAEGKIKVVAASEKWTQWGLRREYASRDYVPGAPLDLPDKRRNLWRGWGVESIEGDVTPWHRLLEFLFALEPEARAFFEQWSAFPIQHPGAKLFQAVVFWGAQGAGKSLLGELFRQIYGHANSSEIGRDQLLSGFNEWAKCKQFVLANEISSHDDVRADADKLKQLITRESIEINVKYQPQFSIRDCVNYLFTSNHADALFLEDGDRRYFVIHAARPIPHELGDELGEWKRNGGASALRYYLERVDLTGYSPTARAPMTKAKAEMVEAGWSDLDRWAHDLVADPDSLLNLGPNARTGRDMYRLEELREACEQTCSRIGSGKALGNALRRAGVERTDRVRTKRGRVHLWIVRNQERWLGAKEVEIAAAYDASMKDSKY